MEYKKRGLGELITYDFLVEHHYNQKKSVSVISKEINYSAQAICYHAKKFDFKFLKDELKKGKALNSSTKFKKGMKPWNYGLRGYKVNNKTKPQPKGKDHWSWKGNGDDRYKGEYKRWRKSVYERDAYTCQECKQVGGKLNAHHIKEWCNYPELRFDINNGLTLCLECHKKTHNFGNKAKQTLKIV